MPSWTLRFAPTPLKLLPALAFAAVATAGTLVLRLEIQEYLGGLPTLMLFLLPIMLSSYLGGVRAGLLATAMTYVLATFYLLPVNGVLVTSGADRWQQGIVILVGVVISLVHEAVHRGRHRADEAIEEHQRYEHAVRGARPLQDAILSSPISSWIATDVHGVIQIFNVGAERMLGYASAEIVNRTTPVIFHDPQELAERAMSLSLEFDASIAPGFEVLAFKASRGIEDVHELTMICKDGSRFPAMVMVAALRDAREATIGYLLIGTDNTARRQAEEDRKRAEEAKRKSEARYRTLFECAPDGIVVADSKGHYLDVNGTMCHMLGYPRSEFIGLHASDIVAESERAHVTPALESIASGDDHHREWRFRRKDGSAFDAEVIATMMPDGNHIAMIRDVTDRKLADECLHRENLELMDASRLKSEFLANMSHELRTPLNAIIGFSEVLRDGLIGEISDQQRRFIGDIFGSGTHLLALINDVLDLSKVEAGMMTLDLEPMRVSAVAVNSLSMVREKAMSHNIRLDIDAPEALGDMQADERKVRQIIYNLLSNAVKFTNDGGRVRLHAGHVTRAEVGRLASAWRGRNFPLAQSEFAEFLEISVTDDGIGISPEGLDQLFKPFSQIDSGLARTFEGTGLGLAMVKVLAELHGGTVAAESAAGEGSRFTVWLPFRLADENILAKLNDSPHPTREPLLETRTALVVEGDPKASHLIRMQLEAEGFEVLIAPSAEAALVLAVQQPLALITLDIMLPDMNGWECLGRIKQLPNLHRVPVVVMSIAADRKRGFALGAAAVMQKPISRLELFETLVDLGLFPRSQGQTLRVLVVDDDPAGRRTAA